MRWKKFGSRPTKSLAELKAEVDKLKEAEAWTKAYETLQDEKEKITKEIKKEGFKIKHRKALAIIHDAESIIGRIGKKAMPYAHRYLKKKRSKFARYI